MTAPKGRPTPRQKPAVSQTSAEKAIAAQRKRVHDAIIQEAQGLLDIAYARGMELLARSVTPEQIIETLEPIVVEAETVKSTASRFASADA